MCKRLLTALALGAAITSSSGCTTTETVFVQEPLPIPDRPALPRIPAAELECLADGAYEALVERDATQAAHIDRLERIIQTTHE